MTNVVGVVGVVNVLLVSIVRLTIIINILDQELLKLISFRLLITRQSHGSSLEMLSHLKKMVVTDKIRDFKIQIKIKCPLPPKVHLATNND